MSDKKYKVTVEIFGEKYSLKSDIETEKALKIAALVDERMKKISKANFRLSPGKIAVLAALNIAEEFLQLEHDYKQLIQMVKEEN